MTNGATRFEPKRLPGYSEANLLQEIRRVVEEEFQGHVPGPDQFKRASRRVGITTLYRRFGSYQAAMAKAGFTYTKTDIKRQYLGRKLKYTDEQLLSNLRDVLIRAEGYEFSLDFYRKNGGLSEKSIKNNLGLSWGAALEKIGAKKRLHEKRVHVIHISAYQQKWRAIASLTNDDLLKELDRVWQENGRCPTRGEFKRLSTRLDAGTYARRFGSWSRAINALCTAKGIPVPRISGTSVSPKINGAPASKDVLLEELRTIQSRCPSEVFTCSLYKKNGGTYSIATFQHHFGSWAKAVEAVGSVAGHLRYSKDQLFDELQRLWEQFGRQPLFREMDEKGTISGATYHKQFGSWTKAVHAFCEDRNSSSALLAPPELPSSDDISCELEGRKIEIAVPEAVLAPLIIIRKTSRAVPMRLRWRVLERDNFTCKACGRDRVNDNIKLHADHILAWSKGGETVFENLQTLCMECNSGKSDL